MCSLRSPPPPSYSQHCKKLLSLTTKAWLSTTRTRIQARNNAHLVVAGLNHRRLRTSMSALTLVFLRTKRSQNVVVQIEAAVAARGSLVGHDSQVVQALY